MRTSTKESTVCNSPRIDEMYVMRKVYIFFFIINDIKTREKNPLFSNFVVIPATATRKTLFPEKCSMAFIQLFITL